MKYNILVTLSLVFVVRTASLKEGLVDTSTTSNNTNSRTSRARDSLLRTRWEANTGLVVVRRVSNDGGIVARCTGERTPVADLLLDVADDRSFRKLANGEDVADGQSSLLSAVDKSTSMHALGCDERLAAKLVPVRIAEDDTGKGGTTTRVVNNLFHDAANVAIPLRIVEVAELGGCLVVMSVSFEL